MESVEEDADVDVDDVAVLERACIRDAVTCQRSAKQRKDEECEQGIIMAQSAAVPVSACGTDISPR